VQLLGGSLAEKRVLDLGCNAGFWSLCATLAGCDYVLGIDGRQMHIDQANIVFEVEGVERSRYDFVEGDLFGIDFREFGRFDIVLCLGLMYHVSKHVELMEKISEVNEDVLLIDTALSMLPDPRFEVRREGLEDPRMAVDYELVMVPTWEAVLALAQQFGYTVAPLKPHFDDYTGSDGYRDGHRRAFLCAKRTDVSRVAAEMIATATGIAARLPPERTRTEGRDGRGGEAWATRTPRGFEAFEGGQAPDDSSDRSPTPSTAGRRRCRRDRRRQRAGYTRTRAGPTVALEVSGVDCPSSGRSMAGESFHHPKSTPR
jgi:SAM-dependent methyltransferase